MIPIFLIWQLLATTLYSSPESDDFCFANRYRSHGLLGGILTWYYDVQGRIFPLFLITVPEPLSNALGVDLFTLYPILLLVLGIALVAGAMLIARRLWPTASKLQVLFLGVALAAVLMSEPPSLREMLYWLPGVVSYLPAGMIAGLLLVDLFRPAAPPSRGTVALLSALCFLAATSNEFTPLWLLAIIGTSLCFRFLMHRDRLELRAHLTLGIATLVGFAIVLSAPGNIVRFNHNPEPRNIIQSASEAYAFFSQDAVRLLGELHIQGWLATAALFTWLLPPVPRSWARGEGALLGVVILVLTFLCGYLAYLVGQFAIGQYLAARARNEVVILAIVGLTCCVVLVVQALVGSRAADYARSHRQLISVVATFVSAILLLPLLWSSALSSLRAERDTFDAFRQESLARHQLLRTASTDAVVVPNRSVRPEVLMAEDLTDNPYRLPNDCIAEYYKKKSVLLLPEAPDKLLAALPALVSLIQKRNEELEDGVVDAGKLKRLGYAIPGALAQGGRIASPWGPGKLFKSGHYYELDFHSVPPQVCPRLLSEGSRIPGVLRIATAGGASAERAAPLSIAEAETECANKTFVRFIVDASASGPATTDDLVRSLPPLIAAVRRHAADLPVGAISPSMLRRLKIDVPAILVRGGRFLTPMGQPAFVRGRDVAILDLYAPDAGSCRELLVAGSLIPGVLRAAGSSASADELAAPVTAQQAAPACAKGTGMVRLIIGMNDAKPRPRWHTRLGIYLLVVIVGLSLAAACVFALRRLRPSGNP